MKRFNLRYYLKEGISNFFSHRLMSVAAITVIAACLLITSSFSLVAYNLGIQVADLETQSEIMLWVDETYTRPQAQALEEEIKQVDNVETVEFIPKEESLEDYKEQMGDDAYILEGLENDNPLRDGYRIVMKDVSLHQETVDALEKIDGIASTTSKKEFSDKLVKMRSVVNAISYTLIAMLGAVSIFIISNTVKLAMFARREEIAIMRMVGATNGFIRWPFVYEGFLFGLIGAAVAFLLQWGLYGAVAKGVANNDTLQLIQIIPFTEMWLPVAGTFAAAGVVIGVGGSLSAIRKFLQV